MKLLGLLILFITLALSYRANAETVDSLPPAPYVLYPLVNVARLKLPAEEFLKAIESDPNNDKVISALLKRGGKPGQDILDVIAKISVETISETDERLLDANLAAFLIFFRDHGRAVFKLAGYSFDKSFITFADDCNTFGSCAKVIDIILERAKNREALHVWGLFYPLCAPSTPALRQQFLPQNLARACTQMMSTQDMKVAVCEIANDFRKKCEPTSKSKYCTGTENPFYPEFDCNSNNMIAPSNKEKEHSLSKEDNVKGININKTEIIHVN